MTKVITRNTTVPTKKSEFFSTSQDNQPSVQINVLQGERELAQDNKSLGEFKLDGIPPAPRSVPKIEVTFDIDVNGILMVRAKDNTTGAEQSITVEGSSKLSEDDIQRMVSEAEEFAVQDKKRREIIEVTNEIDSLTNKLNKALEKDDFKDNAELKQLLLDLNEAKSSEDVEKCKLSVSEAQQKLTEITSSSSSTQEAEAG